MDVWVLFSIWKKMIKKRLGPSGKKVRNALQWSPA